MNWIAGIKKINKANYKSDYPYCTNGRIDSKEKAINRAKKVFKKRKYSVNEYKIFVYESSI